MKHYMRELSKVYYPSIVCLMSDQFMYILAYIDTRNRLTQFVNWLTVIWNGEPLKKHGSIQSYWRHRFQSLFSLSFYLHNHWQNIVNQFFSRTFINWSSYSERYRPKSFINVQQLEIFRLASNDYHMVRTVHNIFVIDFYWSIEMDYFWF